MDERARAYQAYLETHHAGFAVPAGLVEQMVLAATGTSLVASRRIVKGADN